MHISENVPNEILMPASDTRWPELPYEAWNDTRETLHRWMQVLGKIKLKLTPLINHWWNVAFYVTPRGITTGTIPYGDRWFDLELDLEDGYLHLRTSSGGARHLRLEPRSVAEFYARVMSALRAEGIEARIWPVPVEIDDPIPLDHDDRHHSYDKRFALRFWQIAARTTEILTRFRARFIGKASPVLFFWGTFDLSASRFSGRRAPANENLNRIEREAYSHEVSSVGFWPGDSRLEQATFFSYIAPEPVGYPEAKIPTPHAYYHQTLHGFYLPYEDMRRSRDPENLLLDFYQSTYEAAANLAQWNRPELERDTAP
ncbi:MAG: hypothetical protein JWO36_4416 [Myxococcales bacterium]|nr:hypothetical protein [Myxococcales bacterium]